MRITDARDLQERVCLTEKSTHLIASDYLSDSEGAGVAVQEQSIVESLYRDFGGQLLGFLGGRIGSSDAEDAAQDLFLRLWQKEKSGQLESPRAKSYLFSSANNLAIDEFRKRSVRPEADIEDSELLEQGPATDTLVHWQHAGRTLTLAVKSMPELTQSIFLLHHVGGLRYQDIARQLKLSQRTVERHMSRAHQVCRDGLQQYMERDDAE